MDANRESLSYEPDTMPWSSLPVIKTERVDPPDEDVEWSSDYSVYRISDHNLDNNSIEDSAVTEKTLQVKSEVGTCDDHVSDGMDDTQSIKIGRNQYEHQSDLQHEHQPDYQHEHQLDYQHEHQSDLQHEHQLDHQHEHQLDYQHEHQSDHQHEHQLDHQHEHQLDYQHEHQSGHQHEHQPDLQHEHQPDHQHEHQPDHQHEYQPDHQHEHQPDHQGRVVVVQGEGNFSVDHFDIIKTETIAECSHSDSGSIASLQEPVPVQVFKNYLAESHDENQMCPSIKLDRPSIDQTDLLDMGTRNQALHCDGAFDKDSHGSLQLHDFSTDAGVAEEQRSHITPHMKIERAEIDDTTVLLKHDRLGLSSTVFDHTEAPCINLTEKNETQSTSVVSNSVGTEDTNINIINIDNFQQDRCDIGESVSLTNHNIDPTESDNLGIDMIESRYECAPVETLTKTKVRNRYQSSEYQPTERMKKITELPALSLSIGHHILSDTNRDQEAVTDITECSKDEDQYVGRSSALPLDKGFTNSKRLTKNCDVPGRLYKCFICDMEYSCKNYLTSHLRSHKGENGYTCDTCGNIFPTLRSFKKHIKTHLDKKQYSCGICMNTFLDARSLQTHKKSHTNAYSCEFCKRRCKYLSVFRGHLRTHTGEKPFACTICRRRFARRDTLKSHMSTHTGEKPFTCKECKNSFPRLESLKNHMLLHTGEKPFTCKECKKSFSRLITLKTHMLTHTGEKPFICKVCGGRFSQSSSLNLHMLIHTGEKPFTCNKCQMGFSRLYRLKQHMFSHTGIKPFACNVCHKSFSRSSSLREHMLIHTCEKPFTCEICSKGFAVSTVLKRHLLTHTGEKQLTCTQCNRSFSRANSSTTDMVTHIGEKSNECKESDKNYTDAVSLSHNGEKPFICKECQTSVSHRGTLPAPVKTQLRNHLLLKLATKASS